MTSPSRGSAGRRVLRVYFDFAHRWPLWEPETDKYAMEPADYGFSEDLTNLLRRWYEIWEATVHFAMLGVGRSPTMDDWVEAIDLKHQALEAIRREVPADVEVREGRSAVCAPCG